MVLLMARYSAEQLFIAWLIHIRLNLGPVMSESPRLPWASFGIIAFVVRVGFRNWPGYWPRRGGRLRLRAGGSQRENAQDRDDGVSHGYSNALLACRFGPQGFVQARVVQQNILDPALHLLRV